MNQRDLHDYQIESIEHILTHPKSGLFLDMGLGKTVSTLTAIDLLYRDLDIDNVLIIAPKRVAEYVWDSEIKKWDHLKSLTISKIIGTEKERKEAINKKSVLYTIGRDNVAWLVDHIRKTNIKFDMLIIDESSSFKNPRSIRFKRLKTILNLFNRIVILSGTPIPNGLLDLWSQIFILDQGQRLGKFLTRYREKYFYPDRSNGFFVFKYEPIPGSEELIQDRISDICISMNAKDYIKLPDKFENDIDLYLTPLLKEKYKEFEKEKILEFMNKEISVANAAVLTNKLVQFTSGFLYDDNSNPIFIHDIKITALKETLESLNSNVLIAWTYKAEKDLLLKELEDFKPRSIESEKDILDWNEGTIKVLLMHPASGGHGLNLQEGGCNIIWFSQTWSLELEKQLNARLYRQGQTKPVFIHRLIMKGTIDETIRKAITHKDKTQDYLLESIKAKIKEYSTNI